MNVLLKPELEKFIAERVKAGQYADANDLVNSALEMFKEHEEAPEYDRYLRDELARGTEQLDRGETSDFTAESIIAEERRKLSQNQGHR